MTVDECNSEILKIVNKEYGGLCLSEVVSQDTEYYGPNINVHIGSS